MIGVELDATALIRGLEKFAAGLEREGARRGLENATHTAEQIRSGVPVLTGRLAGTVKATRTPVGGDVHYGGTLPYARKIERREHAVATAVENAPGEFHRAMVDVAAQEVARL